MTPKPPKRALQFLRWFCREDYLDEIEGDLVELFHKHHAQAPAIARLLFYGTVVRYFRPAFMKSFRKNFNNPIPMFKHTMLITYRTFLRFRSSFVINITGLSCGLTSALLILLWINDEMTVNHFNKHEDRLYQVMQNLEEVGAINTGPGTPGLMARTLAEELPEVEMAVSFVPPEIAGREGIASHDGRRFKAGAAFASEDFFRMFNYPLIEGSAERVLADRNQVVISAVLATKLFGTTNAVGSVVEWEGDRVSGPFAVAGVFTNPEQAVMQFDILFNYQLFMKDRPWLETWTSSDPLTYVLLKEGASGDAFNKAIHDIGKRKDKNSRSTYLAQQFADVYLYNHFENGVPDGGRILYVRLFGIVGLFLLVIACINFMNLSTARASRRLKEVGIKKSIGAARSSLVIQYLGESMLMALLSAVVAVMLSFLLLPFFNEVTGKHLTLTLTMETAMILVAIVLVTGVLAGSYPALYISAFKPVAILKGKIHGALGDLWARRALVVFQFTLSVILIVAVAVVYRQMEFIRNKNLGLNRDNIVYFNVEKQSQALLDEIRHLPGVMHAGPFYHNVTGDHGGTFAVDWPGRSPDDMIDFGNLEMGHGMVETLGLEMASGNSFSEERSWDTQIIFNEAAIKAMDLKDPIGTTVHIWGNPREIVGVVKNFNFESLYEEVTPCFLFLVPVVDGAPAKIMVKVQAGAEAATVAQLSTIYKKYNPGLPFEYSFLDYDYDALYVSEQRVSVLSRYFAGIAIFVSCLGLFGLVSFMAERRTKEIGIRKILGASEFSIIRMLTGGFAALVLVSIVIALPVCIVISNYWLGQFAYHTEAGPGLIAGASLVVLFIALATVVVETLRTARVNPAACLRSE